MGENWTFDAENLTAGYDGKTVIADVNFSVGAGERILLCGANGLGKSTLLRTLALLQPPVSGNVHFPPAVKNAAQSSYLQEYLKCKASAWSSSWQQAVTSKPTGWAVFPHV